VSRERSLKGWLASVKLTKLEEEALSRVPKGVFAEYCDELLGSRVSRALESWYPDRENKAWGGLCPVGNSGYSRLAAHQLMLSDRVRMVAFDSAISRAVKKGDIVADIGTGTGILSMIACRAGALRVYAIERDEVAALAAEIIDSNGWNNVVSIIAGDAKHVAPRESADVLVSECLGSGGVGTTQIAAVLNARKLWLRPNGIMIPASVKVVVALVESILTELYLRFWESRPGGFDYHPASAWARDQMYTAILWPDELLSAPKNVFELKFCTDQEYHGFKAQAEFSVHRHGTVHGLAVWFRAELFDGVSLDTAPGQPLTHWYQCFLPMRCGVAVQPGDNVQVFISHHYRERESVWDWSVRIGEINTSTIQQTTAGIYKSW